MDVYSISQTCSVPISLISVSRKLANIVSFKYFESAYTFAFTTSALFFAGMAFWKLIYFKNCFIPSLQKLKRARKSVVFIAFQEWTRNARFSSNMTFDAAATVKSCYIISGYGKDRMKKEMELKTEMERTGKRKQEI